MVDELMCNAGNLRQGTSDPLRVVVSEYAARAMASATVATRTMGPIWRWGERGIIWLMVILTYLLTKVADTHGRAIKSLCPDTSERLESAGPPPAGTIARQASSRRLTHWYIAHL